MSVITTNAALGPPPLQTPITGQGPDEHGIPWQNRTAQGGVASGELNPQWAAHLSAMHASLVDAQKYAVSVLSYGAKCDGVSDDSGPIEAAFAVATVSGGNVLFPGGVCYIGKNLSTPSNVALVFNSGAGISVGATFTLTVNGTIIAQPQQVFSGSGLVQFTAGAFQNGPIAGPLVEWFGGGTAVADNTAAIQLVWSVLATVGGGVRAASWAGGVVTIQTKGLHQLATGNLISIAGVNPTGYNVSELAVTVTDATHFTVAVVVNPGAYVSGGTITQLFPGGNTASNTPYPPILFGPGKYVWAGTIDMPNGQYICLAGTGIDSTFLVHSPTVANTDGIKWRTTDGQYKQRNSVREMTIFSTTTNTRYLTFLSQQLRFHEFRVKHSTSTSTPAAYLTRLSGLDTCGFYDCEWYFAGTDNILFNRDGSGPVSTSTAFINCNTESAAGAGINLQFAVTIGWYGGVIQANNYGLNISAGSMFMPTSVHFEGNLTSAIFNNDAATVSFVMSTGNRYSGPGGSDILIDIDGVSFKTVNDHVGGVHQLYRTTVHSVVYQFGDPSNYLEGSGVSVMNSGAGQFFGFGTPQKVEATYNAGNQAATWQLFLNHGSWQQATLTGNVDIDISPTVPGWAPGTMITLELIQDGTGGRTVTWDATTYTVDAALTTVGNVAGARCYITLKLNTACTVWEMVGYVPWFIGGFGYFNSLAMAFAGTLEVDGNSVTIGATLDASLGLSYEGSPPLLDFDGSGVADDWIGESSAPHRAGTIGTARAGRDQVKVDSGTQTYAIGRQIDLPGGAGAVTNFTGLRIGARTRKTGNWGIYDDSGNTWVITGLPTSAAGLPSGGLWRDAAAGNVLKVVP